MLDFVVVIPARLKSFRLPNKPLIKILGKEMILRTIERCKLCLSQKFIYVATDSIKLKNFLKKNNFTNVILTSSRNKTGTDRIFDFSKTIKAKRYINVQGDEPIVNPNDISKIIEISKKNNDFVYNGYAKVINEKSSLSKNIPKLVLDKNKNLLYMSRSEIPSSFRTKNRYFLKQICIYSFPRKILQKVFRHNKKSNLENFEDIEILRFLESGYKVKMVKLSGKSMAVDVFDDIKKVEAIIKKNEKSY
jgi:3-deoxy-manno-octulosonate cytidylyltransferase (CMP-KDO synthetase)